MASEDCAHDWAVIVPDLGRPERGLQVCDGCGTELPRLHPAGPVVEDDQDLATQMLNLDARSPFGPIARGIVRRQPPRHLTPTFREPS